MVIDPVSGILQPGGQKNQEIQSTEHILRGNNVSRSWPSLMEKVMFE